MHAARGTFVVSEDALRARSASPWTASPDPELVYVHRPGVRSDGELKTESHGILRPTEVAERRTVGVARIAVVGDSVGAAMYLRPEDRLTGVLERRLRAEGVAAEVLNFCVNGYDTGQEARLVETSVARFAPDAVVLLYCLNDPAESVTPIGWFRDPVAPTSHAAAFLRSGLESVVPSMGDTRRPLAPGAGPIGPAADTWTRMYRPSGTPWTSVTRGFDRVAAWASGTNPRTPVLVAIAPLLLPEDPTGDSTRTFRAQVADAAARRGFAVADLQAPVSAHPVADVCVAGGDVYHFGARGHAVLAEALLGEVRRLAKR